MGDAGGDSSFVLNVDTGTITAAAPFTAAAEANFQGELGATITVASEAQLNNAIASIDGSTAAGTFETDISANITASGTAFTGIVLHFGVSLDIVGGGHTLSGGGSYRGLFAYGGNVTVSNLTIVNAKAYGGAGGSSYNFAGGGGAGLGGERR